MFKTCNCIVSCDHWMPYPGNQIGSASATTFNVPVSIWSAVPAAQQGSKEEVDNA